MGSLGSPDRKFQIFQILARFSVLDFVEFLSLKMIFLFLQGVHQKSIMLVRPSICLKIPIHSPRVLVQVFRKKEEMVLNFNSLGGSFTINDSYSANCISQRNISYSCVPSLAAEICRIRIIDAHYPYMYE